MVPNDEKAFSPELAAARHALLREGIVVVDEARERRRTTVSVTGMPADRAIDVARSALPDADVEWVGDTPRTIVPRACWRYREREPGRLQLRVVLGIEEHADEILVIENAASIVVLVFVCTPTNGAIGGGSTCRSTTTSTTRSVTGSSSMGAATSRVR